MLKDEKFVSPEIAVIPRNSPKRLVDCGMLHYEASIAGYNERYHKGETSHTIHVWWARRPHSAMRSLLFATLSKKIDEESIEIMSKLAMDNNPKTEQIARQIIRDGYDYQPKVLDMFGGGGTIPLEAKNLGIDSYSIDANQLSVFIQKCNMVYADSVDLNDAKNIVARSGKKVLNRLKDDTDWLYPLRNTEGSKIFGYMWTYKTKCPKCGREFYLTKRPFLTTKKGKRMAFIKQVEGNKEIITFGKVNDDYKYDFAWKKGTGKCFCPNCNCQLDEINALECDDALIALIKTDKEGKEFLTPTNDAIPSYELIRENENRVLKEIEAALPTSELPVWSGIVNPALYGIKTHADFLNKRQRLFLIYLIKELLVEYYELSKDDETMAKFVIGALSSLIDQVVDWNCRLSMWIPSNEQVGRAFCGPGVAMLWDYTETDMMLKGPANIWDKLKRIVNGISSFEKTNGKITIKHAHAQELPFDDNMFDAIVTDPPYYDNIYYSILADFFYAWKRILLKRIEPELFIAEITDTKYELVASSKRKGKGEDAHDSYCIELKEAFKEAARVLRYDGIFSFIYSHSSVNGWDAIIQAYRSSPFIITSVQPLSIERKGRPRAVMSEAVNTCMTFVARKTDNIRSELSYDELVIKTNNVINTFGKHLTNESGWNSFDAGLAVLAYAVGLIANSSRIAGVKSDVDALIRIGKIIKKELPEFVLKVRKSL